MLQQVATHRPLESDQELQQKLQQAEDALKQTEARRWYLKTGQKHLKINNTQPRQNSVTS